MWPRTTIDCSITAICLLTHKIHRSSISASCDTRPMSCWRSISDQSKWFTVFTVYFNYSLIFFSVYLHRVYILWTLWLGKKRWLRCSNDTLNGTTPVTSQTKHDINVGTCESNTVIITSLRFISSLSSPWKNFQLISGATVSTRLKSHTCTQLYDCYYVDGEKLGNVLADRNRLWS